MVSTSTEKVPSERTRVFIHPLAYFPPMELRHFPAFCNPVAQIQIRQTTPLRFRRLPQHIVNAVTDLGVIGEVCAKVVGDLGDAACHAGPVYVVLLTGQVPQGGRDPGPVRLLREQLLLRALSLRILRLWELPAHPIYRV